MAYKFNPFQGNFDLVEKYRGFTQTVTVSKDTSDNADFDTIQGAIDSITDNSTTKRYAVLVYPGIYTENVVMEEYVSIIAVGDHEATTIISTSGTTLTAPAGISDAAVIGFKIESTPTANGAICLQQQVGKLDIYDCYFKMTSATNGIVGRLIDMNSGDLAIQRCKLLYEMTGTSVGTNTHNPIDIDGVSLFDMNNCLFEGTVADADDNLHMVDDNSDTTEHMHFSNNHFHAKLTHASASGEIELFSITGVSSERVLFSNYLVAEATGGTNTATCECILLNSAAGGAKLDSWANRIELGGFLGDNDVFKAQAGDEIISRYDALEYTDDLFEGAGTLNMMPFVDRAVSEGASITTSTAYQDKLSITLPAGRWLLQYNYTIKGDTDPMLLRTRVRDVTNSSNVGVSFINVSALGANNSITMSGFQEVTITADTTYTIQYKSDNVANTIKINDVRFAATKLENGT